jgi:cell division initiation protein
MQMSARDVINKQFHDQWRGYNQQEVDDFLDRIAESLDTLVQENAALQTRIRELDQAVSTSRETEEMLKKTLVTAQQAAEKAIATAKEKAEKLILEAEERVKKVNADADERVQSAQAEVQRRAMDAQRQYDLKKRELDSTIDKLAAYETELKEKLKSFLQQERAYLEQQLRALESLNNNGSAPRPGAATSTSRPLDQDALSSRPAGVAVGSQTQPIQARPSGRQATPTQGSPEADKSQPDSDEDEADDAHPARRSVRSLFWRDDS